jgi:hypothetical protein
MKTFTIKTEIEQFQEQCPELYQQIFDLGYNTYKAQEELLEESWNEDWENNYQQYAKPKDCSTRYSLYDTWDIVYKKAQDLEFEGYMAGNRDWVNFMLIYQNSEKMYIAWNPTHKEFAIDSDSGPIDEIYPNLTKAVFEGYTPIDSTLEHPSF